MFKKILVALDGSPTAEQILPRLETLRNGGCEIHLLRVAVSRSIAGADAAKAQLEVLREAEEYLSHVEEKLHEQGLHVESHIRFGHPAEEILDHCQHWHYDLIAMTTHGRSGVSRLLMGSVAENVIRKSAVPVLVIRAR